MDLLLNRNVEAGLQSKKKFLDQEKSCQKNFQVIKRYFHINSIEILEEMDLEKDLHPLLIRFFLSNQNVEAGLQEVQVNFRNKGKFSKKNFQVLKYF